ncbi:MAG: HAD hydrolase family protein [Candidatus Saganbacteria bacterium]|nr:HAD hydrolase family protein [Candidatus Saganbacteria bacterium]
MIKIVVMDIDGVLTDGKVTFDSSGNEFKTIDYRDIDAIFELKRRGLKVGVITGESTSIAKVIRDRFQPDFFYSGCKDKAAALNEIRFQTKTTREEICFVGDGKYDVAAMKLAGLAVCPANAVPAVKAVANRQLKCAGGAGCLLELLEYIGEAEQP